MGESALYNELVCRAQSKLKLGLAPSLWDAMTLVAQEHPELAKAYEDEQVAAQCRPSTRPTGKAR